MDPLWIVFGAGAALTLTLGIRFYLTFKRKTKASAQAQNGDAYSVNQTNIRTSGGDNAGRDITKNNQG